MAIPPCFIAIQNTKSEQQDQRLYSLPFGLQPQTQCPSSPALRDAPQILLEAGCSCSY